MTAKKVYILAFSALLAIVAAGSWGASRSAKSNIIMVYQPQPNGDFRLSLYGGSGRELVCEERDVRIIQQPDAINPLVVECKHAGGRP